ncbi:MAG: hypothetical protein MUF51_04155, partial [Vicinamibacteria bacterium]|nr:hypothetical protein [Vicinamibacteria bacterium]
MNRQARNGGVSTQGSSGSITKVQRRRNEKIDPDRVEFNAIDWETVEPIQLDLDPSLIEHIRTRRRLKQITLRIGAEQIDEARRMAERTGLKYQAVLRRWLQSS